MRRRVDLYGWLIRYLGRKGVALLTAGIACVCQAWALVEGATVVQPGTEGLWHAQQPTWARAGTWAVAGVVAIVLAHPRWFASRWQALGFAVLALPIGIRAASYTAGWVASLVTEEGFARGAGQAVTWLMILGGLLLIAEWPEPPRKPREGAR